MGRHSKSIDITRKCCGLCRGKFELIVNGKVVHSNVDKTPNAINKAPNVNKTPNVDKTPNNRFAIFVKENYKNCRTPGKSHSDAMKLLSLKFGETKLSEK